MAKRKPKKANGKTKATEAKPVELVVFADVEFATASEAAEWAADWVYVIGEIVSHPANPGAPGFWGKAQDAASPAAMDIVEVLRGVARGAPFRCVHVTPDEPEPSLRLAWLSLARLYIEESDLNGDPPPEETIAPLAEALRMLERAQAQPAAAEGAG